MGSPIEITIMGAIHGMTAVTWMGVHIANELYLLPDIKGATKLADAPGLRKAKRISMLGAMLGMGTLITGLIFFFLKWGLRTADYTADPEARTVLIALVVVLVVMGMGMGIMRPLAEGIGKRAATMNPMEAFPEDFKGDLMRLHKMLHISGILVIAAFLLMIVAINGGI